MATTAATKQRVARLEGSLDRWRQEQPEIVEALEVLGLSAEDYEQGLLGYSTAPRTQAAASSRPEPEDADPSS